MSLLYKDPKDVTLKVDITFIDDKINIYFHSDCGKFGTEEALQDYTLTPKRLMQILHEREDYTDEEL